MSSNRSTVRDAFTAFQRGEYQSALCIYRELAERLGASCFEANIRLCERRLSVLDKPSDFLVHQQAKQLGKSAAKTQSPFGNDQVTQPLELQDTLTWSDFNVKSGDDLAIKAAVMYQTKKEQKNRSAVMVITAFEDSGKELGIPCGTLSKSSQLKGYYKYLSCTNGQVSELHSFKVPLGMVRIKVGFCRFHATANDRIVLDHLSIEAKTSAKAQMAFVPPSAQAAELSILGWPEYPPNGKPYVIGIMDEFTTGCFEEDLNLIQPRPDNWYALAEKYKPTLFFIESAWKGNFGSWQYRVADYANKPGPEVAHICEYAKTKGIPTVFWNKEDPVHHEKFMCSAKLVDHIFTTDASMCSSYREKTGNANAHALPFAAQPSLHKPAPLAGRKPRSCFAGSWYGNRHELRGQAMRWLLDAGNRYGMDIYDRNFGTGNFVFPDEYQQGIKGSLPYKQLCDEYSRYRVFLNVNSVTESPTMFSRRVFELLACGTPVVSTYARGIDELFDSKAVWLVNSAKEADEAIHTLMTDDVEWRRRSLAGIREVFARHTYAHRINEMFERIGLENRLPVDLQVLLVAKARSAVDLQALLHTAATLCYPKWKLLIECSGTAEQQSAVPSPNVQLVNVGYLASAQLIADAADSSAIGWLAAGSNYGPNYLRDLSNAMAYQPQAQGWAKSLTVDMFAFDQPTALECTLWNSQQFIDTWRHKDAGQHVQSKKLFVIDSAEFSTANTSPVVLKDQS